MSLPPVVPIRPRPGADRAAFAALAALALSIPAFAAGPKPISASSEAAADDGTRRSAALAFDGLLSTGWAEGDLGDGVGAWLELRLPTPTDVSSVSIFPGWLGGADREIREYGRPKVVTITIDTASGPVTKQERLLDPGDQGPLRHDVAIEAKGAKAIRIALDEVFSGGMYSDTFIAEVAVNLVAGAPPAPVTDLQTWLASDAGQTAANAQRAAAIALFDKIQAEDGDRDSFRTLMDWAADGAPYLRERAASKVPAGFRVAALQPDKTSIEALLKLKDSNAIPAVERASLRVTGALQADLKRRAKLFDAYQELLGGGGRNVTPWGQSGIGKGGLRGYGEPLDIVADSYGGLYVADIGNNRVQRFGIESGVVDKVWGSPEGDVTEVWFDKKREAYASGAAPGTELGQFSNPVDLALIPGKGGDSVLVLDAKGRITLIDPAENVAHVQEIKAEVGIAPGAGGEGHVLYGKGKVVVVWGNEGFVFNLKDWSEAGKFQLEDGVPTSAVMLKSGKLALVYGAKLIMYSTDGFRHGDLLGDSLGGGYQDWAVTLDEKGKLWAALDTGTVVKYKKPGKVDYTVTIGQYSLNVPRIAVYADRVFVTADDKILHADAYELHLKADSGQSATGTLDIPGDE